MSTDLSFLSLRYPVSVVKYIVASRACQPEAAAKAGVGPPMEMDQALAPRCRPAARSPLASGVARPSRKENWKKRRELSEPRRRRRKSDTASDRSRIGAFTTFGTAVAFRVDWDSRTIKSMAIMLAGEPSLECWVKSRDLIKPRIEYFPVGLECRDPMAPDTFEWITVARKGAGGIRTENSMALREAFAALAGQRRRMCGWDGT